MIETALSPILLGLAAGFLLAMPMGALGVMAVQRTLQHGFIAGAIVAAGCGLGDFLVAALSLIISGPLADWAGKLESYTHWAFAAIFAAIGLYLLFDSRKPHRAREPERHTHVAFFTAGLLTNLLMPGNFLAYISFFTAFHIAEMPMLKSCGVLLGVWLGATGMWLGLVGLVARFRNHIGIGIIHKIGRAGGIVLLVVAISFAIFGDRFKLHTENAAIEKLEKWHNGWQPENASAEE